MWPVAAGKRDEAAPRSNAGLSQDVVYTCTSLPFVLRSREICIVIWNKGHDLNYIFDLSIGLYLHVSWLEAFGLQMLWKAWMNDTTHTFHSSTCELWSQQNKTSSKLDILEQKTSGHSRSPTLNSMDCPQICHGPVNFWHLPKPNSNRVILELSISLLLPVYFLTKCVRIYLCIVHGMVSYEQRQLLLITCAHFSPNLFPSYTSWCSQILWLAC
jgi:hypothetical protein